MAGTDSQRGGIWWKRGEIATLGLGLVGSAAACLASYSWHWSKESLFFVVWSALPFGLLMLSNQIVRRLVKSRFLLPITWLLAAALSTLSLTAYTGAVLKPNHSSGMVFFILPLCLMIAIPILFTGVLLGFFVVNRRGESQQSG